MCGGAVMWSLGGAGGCLGPQVDDTEPRPGRVRPPGTQLAALSETDPVAAAQIAELDGVDGVVPALSGFAEGRSIQYWDFGPAPHFATPLYYLSNPDTGQFLDHPPIFDMVPGDPRYSPFWTVFAVPANPSYRGEVLPSVAAIEEAQRLGLVGAAENTGNYVNCPVVADGVTLDPGDGRTPLSPRTGFYRGSTVSHFDMNTLLGLAGQPLADYGTDVPVGDIFRIRRAGGEPMSEPVRGVDITGDGDVLDTNDIISSRSSSHLLRRVSVAVGGANLQLIDDTRDDAVSTLMSGDQLFSRSDDGLEPNTDVVVAFDITAELVNHPFRVRQGAIR
ncbi:MAG: hypothetical protein MJE77_10250 [Proteobacteria bacterium]|nr:hypothetical protein [Pseudomonadota bacterium]